jgi:hypothetical protein
MPPAGRRPEAPARPPINHRHIHHKCTLSRLAHDPGRCRRAHCSDKVIAEHGLTRLADAWRGRAPCGGLPTG